MPRVYWSSSDEAFVLLHLEGNVLKQVRVGHTQTAAVGKFRLELPSLQYVTTNFWKSPEILWDQNSTWIYTQDGPPPSGRVYAPIRSPDYNDSNYRANVSLPRWKEPASR